MRTVLSIVTACLAVGTALPALAEAPVCEKTVKVNRAALDDPAEAGALYTRLKSVSREVCNEGLTGVSGWVVTDRQCERMALERALSTIHHPALNRIHNGLDGQATTAGGVAKNERTQRSDTQSAR